MNLETLKTETLPKVKVAGLAAARWTWKAHVAAATALWAATLWLLATTWSVTKRAGRVALWVLCWPLGLWRSWRHGEDRRNAKMARAIVAAKAEAERDRDAA